MLLCYCPIEPVNTSAIGARLSRDVASGGNARDIKSAFFWDAGDLGRTEGRHECDTHWPPTACSDLGMCAEAAPPLLPQTCEDALTGLFPGKTGACLLLPHCSLAGGWLRTVCLLQSCGAWEGKPGWLPEPGDWRGIPLGGSHKTWGPRPVPSWENLGKESLGTKLVPASLGCL